MEETVKDQELLQQFFQSDLPILLDELRKTQGFPGVCYTASQIISSYFEMKFGRKLPVVCGTFGVDQLFHTWLSLGEDILDVTLFQFFRGGLSKKDCAKLPIRALMEKILDSQSDFLVTDGHFAKAKYHSFVQVEPEYREFWKDGMSFDQFMKEVTQTFVYQHSDWLRGRTVEGNYFAVWLGQNNKRVTKRFFTKYAIVDAM